ncbi:cell wall-binding repeat-containing protein [Citroniella saccharovorans]|uniref:cell wall-binding repeat-containing protein n=2 Tax=Citroniella saccharovorans TaxID=2053367 RepID=UPI00389903BE
MGAFAAREEYPILLVKKNEIPESINKAFKELGIKNVYLAGGVNTVSEKVAKDLPGLIERIAGENRFETAVKIAKEKFAGRESIFLANGHVFADALVISPVAGLLDMPILLTNADTAPKSLTEYIEEENIKAITAVGGQRMVSDKVLEELTK